MTDRWPITIDGRAYHPIPATWLDYGSDADSGEPRCYAVSVAQSARDLIRIRYVARDGGVYVQSTSSKPNPTGAGVVPASLASVHDWPRSIVPPSHVTPVDRARDAERERLQAVWSERVDGVGRGRERELIADGGVDQWALDAVEPAPTDHCFMRRDPEGDECVLCGGDPDPYPCDSVPVQTPDGRVWLRISDDPSCLECRKDVVRQLSRRGLDQEGLDAFA